VRSYGWGCVAGLIGILASVLGCASTSRVADNVTTGQLSQKNKSVALMKVGSVDPSCVTASVLLGRRDGAVFQPARQIDVAGLKAPVAPLVSEVELDPGEYHVIGYSCAAPNGKQVAVTSQVNGVYRSSLAHFQIGAGEILNVGYLQMHAGRVRRNLLSRSVPMRLSVTDWPLDEIERFRKQRPQLFDQMKVRLMTVPNGPSEEERQENCEELARLVAAGKVQTLPASCARTARKA